MTDDFDRLIKDAAPGYNAPPSVDPERVWAGIQAERLERGRAEQRQPNARRVARAAAIVVAIVVPVIGVAQVVSYLKRDRTPPTIPVDVTGDGPQSVPMPGVIPRAASPSDTGSQQGPSSHDLGPVVATSSMTFTGEVVAVALGGGRLLVTDQELLNNALKRVGRVLDSSLTSAKEVAVGSAGYPIPHRGDSALMIDNLPVPPVLVFIDPEGRAARTMALVPAQRGTLGATFTTHQATSSKTMGLFYTSLPGSGPRPIPDSDQWSQRSPQPLFRMAWDTRTIDTVAWFAFSNEWTVGPTGSGVRMYPFSFYDAAVATTDGAVALFRSREYRIEWILPDGTRAPASKPLAYPWVRISDERRNQIVDSINAERRAKHDSVVAKYVADSIAGTLRTYARAARADGAARTGGGAGRGGGARRGATDVSARVMVQLPASRPGPPILILPKAIPDFYPPTTRTTTNIGPQWEVTNRVVFADADNNVWIRPDGLRAPDGAWVWEVVNRERGLIERVRIPEDRQIAGFGPGGIVYLIARDGGVARIEKVRVRK
jgi:hypothetical protein